MTISSFAIRNVLNTYQKNLRNGAAPATEDKAPGLRVRHDTAHIVSGRKPVHIRERFGPGAVRDYRKNSLKTYEEIQRLS